MLTSWQAHVTSYIFIILLIDIIVYIIIFEDGIDMLPCFSHEQCRAIFYLLITCHCSLTEASRISKNCHFSHKAQIALLFGRMDWLGIIFIITDCRCPAHSPFLFKKPIDWQASRYFSEYDCFSGRPLGWWLFSRERFPRLSAFKIIIRYFTEYMMRCSYQTAFIAKIIFLRNNASGRLWFHIHKRLASLLAAIHTQHHYRAPH